MESRESATGADIDKMLTWHELARFSQGHGMQDVVYVKHVHVFARNHIDACVVFGVERTQLREL